MTSSSLIEGMNPEQSQVVAHSSGPLLVAAGAGCGKTRVLVHRVARFVEDGADPSRVLAVTFSTKTAREMNDRLLKLGCDGARVGTFHSLALQILREEWPAMRSWQIDDQERYRICVKDAVSYRYMNWKSADVTHLLSYIGRCKAAGALPADPKAMELAQQFYKRRPMAGREPNLCRQAYETAELVRCERQILTFDDMLVEAWKILKSDEEARARWALRWDHVLQDECFVGDTPVLLADGTTRAIKELVSERWQGEVLTWSPVTGTTKRRVTSWARKPLNKRLVRVAVRQVGFRANGERFAQQTEAVRYTARYLVCTDDHPVWTSNRGWVPAGQLQSDDSLQVETIAPWVAGYANRHKHSAAGKSRLSADMTRKNEQGVCGNSRVGGTIVHRGGNGRGQAPSEAALLERLGNGWVYNHVVPTGRSSKNGPTHYKLDLANLELQLAIELDGNSHHGRREQDSRKDAFLEALGWRVVRLTNREAWKLRDDVLLELVARCPAPACVLSVELWEPSEPFVYDIGVDETHAFYADGVLVHNCQDENFVQHEIASMLARDHRSYTIVGDPAQCHPAGTVIEKSCVDGRTTYVAIESLQDGDEVRGWNQNAQKMVGGRKVRVAQRPFFGRLVTVGVGDVLSSEDDARYVRVTPNHRFVARWTTRVVDSRVTYLMHRAGFGYRVGWCELFSRGGEGSIGFHLAQLARIEKADAVWILRTHRHRTDASVYESIIAAKYGLPTATFEPVHCAEHQTAEAIEQIFKAVADDNRARGEGCLADHQRDSKLPLYPWPGQTHEQPQGRRTLFQVHAANLMPEFMSVPLPDRVGAWDTVRSVEAELEPSSRVVYSLQIEGDETYAARAPGKPGPGIVVHNSIYNFRGANPQAMLKFERDWGAQVIRMGRNYRSAIRIVELANKSLAAMPPESHLGVQMLAERLDQGEVKAVVYEDFDAEGEGVTEAILESFEDGRKWSDHVVLFRTNAQSRGVEESLLGARVPYVVIGGTNFYDRREVKDLLAYLRVGEGRGSFDDVRRSINTPFRYLGKAFVEGLQGMLESQHPAGCEATMEAVRSYIMGPARLQQRQRTSSLEWCSIVGDINRAIVAGDGEELQQTPARIAAMPARILEVLVADLRYAEWLTRDEGTESPENNRVSNVRELIRAAARFPTVTELLDYVDDTLERAARAKREASTSDVVTLCSIHRSKGLEWPVVYVLGVNDKILPHAMAEDPDEERRLFYVACTRARDVLQLSCVAKAAVSNRVMDLMPSRFLAEVGIAVSLSSEAGLLLGEPA